MRDFILYRRLIALIFLIFLALLQVGCPDIPVDEVLIKAGSFMMGTPSTELGHRADEKQHKVTLTHDFYLWKYELTQKLFDQLMGYNPSYFNKCDNKCLQDCANKSCNNNDTCGENCPVERVSWDEALAFCNELSKKKGLKECFTCEKKNKIYTCHIKPEYNKDNYYKCEGYRLPTEAEWEYAYRTGLKTAFYNGIITNTKDYDANLNMIAWYGKNSDNTTHPIAQKTPNKWGLYDMSGNVLERVYDGYNKKLGTTSVINPVSLMLQGYHVIRGGSWFDDPQYCRAGVRNYDNAGTNVNYLGFRPARTSLPAPQ